MLFAYIQIDWDLTQYRWKDVKFPVVQLKCPSHQMVCGYSVKNNWPKSTNVTKMQKGAWKAKRAFWYNPNSPTWTNISSKSNIFKNYGYLNLMEKVKTEKERMRRQNEQLMNISTDVVFGGKVPCNSFNCIHINQLWSVDCGKNWQNERKPKLRFLTIY